MALGFHANFVLILFALHRLLAPAVVAAMLKQSAARTTATSVLIPPMSALSDVLTCFLSRVVSSPSDVSPSASNRECLPSSEGGAANQWERVPRRAL